MVKPHLGGLPWLGPHCAAESGEEGAAPPQSPFLWKAAPGKLLLLQPEGGESQERPVVSVLPWGAGEGAPWVPDTVQGSDVLPPSVPVPGGMGAAFPGAGATPAFGSRLSLESRGKAARACRRGEESA